MPDVNENYISTYLHMYGVLPMLYLVEKLELDEEYEKCGIIVSVIKKHVSEFDLDKDLPIILNESTLKIFIENDIENAKILKIDPLEPDQFIKLSKHYGDAIYKEINLKGVELEIFELSESLNYGNIYIDDGTVFWEYTASSVNKIEEAIRVDSEIIKNLGYFIEDNKIELNLASFKIIF